jgi:hypothetical protein
MYTFQNCFRLARFMSFEKSWNHVEDWLNGAAVELVSICTLYIYICIYIYIHVIPMIFPLYHIDPNLFDAFLRPGVPQQTAALVAPILSGTTLDSAAVLRLWAHQKWWFYDGFMGLQWWFYDDFMVIYIYDYLQLVRPKISISKLGAT